jgi:hypothetical protein
VSIFVRHTERCLKGDGTAKNPGLLAKTVKGKPLSPAELRAYKHCSCPKYYTGSYDGKWHPRTSVNANTWEAAEREVQRVRNRLDGKPEEGAASKPAETGVAIDHQITPTFINRWRRSWVTEKSPRKSQPGLKKNTQKVRMARLNHFLSYCVRMEHLGENPIRKVKANRRTRRDRGAVQVTLPARSRSSSISRPSRRNIPSKTGHDSTTVEVIPSEESLVLDAQHDLQPEVMLRIRISHRRGLDQPKGPAEEEALGAVRETLHQLGVTQAEGPESPRGCNNLSPPPQTPITPIEG